MPISSPSSCSFSPFFPMASSSSLSLVPTSIYTTHHKKPNIKKPTQLPLFCQAVISNGSSSDPSNNEEKRQKEQKQKDPSKKSSRGWVSSIRTKVLSEGRKVRESLSPNPKGDLKDLVLMGLSFSVYVYISQKLVCAYCAWMAVLNHH